MQCLFAKLVLENQDDQFYKLYRDSISYNGDPYNRDLRQSKTMLSLGDKTSCYKIVSDIGIYTKTMLLYSKYDSELQMYTSCY